jgi:hypothetical protein
MELRGCWKKSPFDGSEAMLTKETAIPEHGKG